MSQEIDNIRSEMKKLYDDGKIKCDRSFFEELDSLAVEAGELIDRKDRNRAYFALHKFWECAELVIENNELETGKLYRKIWGLVIRYRSW